jgi:hypothetical protein
MGNHAIMIFKWMCVGQAKEVQKMDVNFRDSAYLLRFFPSTGVRDVTCQLVDAPSEGEIVAPGRSGLGHFAQCEGPDPRTHFTQCPPPDDG